VDGEAVRLRTCTLRKREKDCQCEGRIPTSQTILMKKNLMKYCIGSHGYVMLRVRLSQVPWKGHTSCWPAGQSIAQSFYGTVAPGRGKVILSYVARPSFAFDFLRQVNSASLPIVARYRGSKQQQRSSSKRIATESDENTMSIWRLEDGMELKKWEVKMVTALVILRDEKHLLAATGAGERCTILHH
jgi:hypothetical protein